MNIFCNSDTSDVFASSLLQNRDKPNVILHAKHVTSACMHMLLCGEQDTSGRMLWPRLGLDAFKAGRLSAKCGVNACRTRSRERRHACRKQQIKLKSLTHTQLPPHSAKSNNVKPGARRKGGSFSYWSRHGIGFTGRLLFHFSLWKRISRLAATPQQI